MDDRLSAGRRAATVSLGVNAGLALIKLVTGIIGHSYALVADAVESLGDIVSSAIVWGGLVIASKPADENHPYGHGKAEPLAALAVAAMLLAAAAGIAFQAVREIQAPQQAPAGYTLIVLLVVIAIKETMCRYELRTGRRIGSVAIAVDAWHHRSDALTSAAAAIGITITLIGGEGYETADEWAALVACLIICVNGVRFARSAITELMDAKPTATLVESIEAAALGVEGARHVEKVLVRKMGPKLYVDMHLELDPDLTVREAHALAHAVKDGIMSTRPEVADVLVHVEPYDIEQSDQKAR